MEVNLPFGGNVLILGGDFHQVLPVVPKGTKAEMIDACVRTYVFHLLGTYVTILCNCFIL